MNTTRDKDGADLTLLDLITRVAERKIKAFERQAGQRMSDAGMQQLSIPYELPADDAREFPDIEFSIVAKLERKQNVGISLHLKKAGDKDDCIYFSLNPTAGGLPSTLFIKRSRSEEDSDKGANTGSPPLSSTIGINSATKLVARHLKRALETAEEALSEGSPFMEGDTRTAQAMAPIVDAIAWAVPVAAAIKRKALEMAIKRQEALLPSAIDRLAGLIKSYATEQALSDQCLKEYLRIFPSRSMLLDAVFLERSFGYGSGRSALLTQGELPWDGSFGAGRKHVEDLIYQQAGVLAITQATQANDKIHESFIERAYLFHCSIPGFADIAPDKTSRVINALHNIEYTEEAGTQFSRIIEESLLHLFFLDQDFARSAKQVLTEDRDSYRGMIFNESTSAEAVDLSGIMEALHGIEKKTAIEIKNEFSKWLNTKPALTVQTPDRDTFRFKGMPNLITGVPKASFTKAAGGKARIELDMEITASIACATLFLNESMNNMDPSVRDHADSYHNYGWTLGSPLPILVGNSKIYPEITQKTSAVTATLRKLAKGLPDSSKAKKVLEPLCSGFASETIKSMHGDLSVGVKYNFIDFTLNPKSKDEGRETHLCLHGEMLNSLAPKQEFPFSACIYIKYDPTDYSYSSECGNPALLPLCLLTKNAVDSHLSNLGDLDSSQIGDRVLLVGQQIKEEANRLFDSLVNSLISDIKQKNKAYLIENKNKVAGAVVSYEESKERIKKLFDTVFDEEVFILKGVCIQNRDVNIEWVGGEGAGSHQCKIEVVNNTTGKRASIPLLVQEDSKGLTKTGHSWKEFEKEMIALKLPGESLIAAVDEMIRVIDEKKEHLSGLSADAIEALKEDFPAELMEIYLDDGSGTPGL